MIWNRPFTLDQLNRRGENTLIAHLGIEITEIGSDYLKGRMPVDSRTHQPLGLLHGGASVAFAETLASLAGNLVVDPETHYIVGQEINANHVRSATSGYVEGWARPIHIGSRSQIWETRIEQDGKLICISRMTAFVVARDPKRPMPRPL